MIMRGGSGGRLHRFVLLPFSIRCHSESSVALADAASNTRPNSHKHNSKKGLFTQGLHRLIKGFNTFSQIFFYKQEREEMEIGFPTDVKHVTHIGIDGKGDLKGAADDAHQLLSFPCISLHQFELAMAAQSHAPITA